MKSIARIALVSVCLAMLLACSNPLNSFESLETVQSYEGSSRAASTGALNLVTARSNVNSVTLPNGRVLIAGGQHDYGTYTGPLTACEIFDGRKAPYAVRPMQEARFGHTLTVLANGTVLATGGSYQDSRLRYFRAPVRSSAEIFNPSTGRWKLTGSMNFERAEHAAVLLKDGQVLIAGGRKEVELYNPRTGKFTVVANLNFARNNIRMVALKDGRVLVLGYGDVVDGVSELTAEIYYPDTKTFKLTIPANIERAGRFSATLLTDGRVLIVGGDTDVGNPATAEIFDPITGEFSLLGSLSTDRCGHSATLLADGSVLIAGGEGIVNRDAPESEYVTGLLSSVEIIYPDTGKIVQAVGLSSGRAGHGEAFIVSKTGGTPYILGGTNGSGSLASIEAPNLTVVPTAYKFGNFMPLSITMYRDGGTIRMSGHLNKSTAAEIRYDGRFNSDTRGQIFVTITGYTGIADEERAMSTVEVIALDAALKAYIGNTPDANPVYALLRERFSEFLNK